MTLQMTNPDTTTDDRIDWIALADDVGRGLRDGVRERDRTGQISPAVFDELRNRGLTSALVPTEFGGGGASFAELAGMLRRIGFHDAATAVTLSMHSHLVAAQVWRHRHGIDAEKVFRKVVDDRAVLVSTGASDWVASNGSAEKVEGGFRVSGRKSPASGCEVGNVLVTSIRWESPDGPQVLHCSIPMNTPGVGIDPTWDTLGLRATGSHTVVLDDVFVPDAAVSLVRQADVWHPVWNTVMGVAMPLIMAAYVGIADAAADIAIEVTRDRGRSEAHVLQELGQMENAHRTAVDMLTAMVDEADDLHFANTDDVAARTLSRKTVIADAVIATVRHALEAVGGSGFSRSSDLERLLRDAHAVVFHPLPAARQIPFSARVALGLTPVA